GSVGRPAVRCEHDLDRSLEQRTQPGDDLFARHALTEPLGRDLETPAEVGERVADDDRTAILEPEHHVVLLSSGEDLDSERQTIAGGEQVLVDRVVSEEPRQVGTAPGSLLGDETVLLHQVLLRIGPRREDRRSTRLWASRSCQGAVSTTTDSRLVARSSI